MGCVTLESSEISGDGVEIRLAIFSFSTSSMTSSICSGLNVVITSTSSSFDGVVVSYMASALSITILAFLLTLISLSLISFPSEVD